MTPREGENRFGEIVWEPSYHPLVSDRRGGVISYIQLQGVLENGFVIQDVQKYHLIYRVSKTTGYSKICLEINRLYRFLQLIDLNLQMFRNTGCLKVQSTRQIVKEFCQTYRVSLNFYKVSWFDCQLIPGVRVSGHISNPNSKSKFPKLT